VLGLRYHDPAPEWVTHVAIAKESRVISGSMKDLHGEILRTSHRPPSGAVPTNNAVHFARRESPIIVEVKGLNVAYEDREARSLRPVRII
jgi:hypothetical protein